MTTLSPSMSILALLKAGIMLDGLSPNIRLYRSKETIIVERLIDGVFSWQNVREFPLTGAGLKEACEYWNLPF